MALFIIHSPEILNLNYLTELLFFLMLQRETLVLTGLSSQILVYHSALWSGFGVALLASAFVYRNEPGRP